MSLFFARWLGRAGRALYIAYGVAIIAAVMLTLWVVSGFVRRPGRAIALQRAASRLMLACLGCRITVRGVWPRPGASARVSANVFVANHTSNLDIPLMLAASTHDFAFLTKRELLDWPIFSRITRTGAHIPVDRDRAESRGAVVARMVKTLRAGRDVVIFPEGTFSHDDGSLRPFHAGAFKAAVAAGVPVVPVAIGGVARVWSQHARFIQPGRIEIWIGEALAPAPAGDAQADPIEPLREAALHFIAGRIGEGADDRS
jgi:1-acyl-sn-glycerol-3-phosphate acyltransferase